MAYLKIGNLVFKEGFSRSGSGWGVPSYATSPGYNPAATFGQAVSIRHFFDGDNPEPDVVHPLAQGGIDGYRQAVYDAAKHKLSRKQAKAYELDVYAKKVA